MGFFAEAKQSRAEHREGRQHEAPQSAPQKLGVMDSMVGINDPGALVVAKQLIETNRLLAEISAKLDRLP